MYPRETVVAEKLQALVMLGIANSRMKDFFDLWILARQFEFQGPPLCDAIRATFARRRTELPAGPPLAFTPDFTKDTVKQAQWLAFVRKGTLIAGDITLADVTDELASFLMPPVDALVRGIGFHTVWSPPGPWKE